MATVTCNVEGQIFQCRISTVISIAITTNAFHSNTNNFICDSYLLFHNYYSILVLYILHGHWSIQITVPPHLPIIPMTVYLLI